MRTQKLIYIILVIFCFLGGCKNIDDVTPKKITSFIRFYEEAGNFTATNAEVLPDGFIILGYTGINETASMVLIRTDNLGNILQQHSFPGAVSKALHVQKNSSNGNIDGFLIGGEEIIINPGIEPVANQEIISAKIIRLDAQGNILAERLIKDEIATGQSVKIDFRVSAVTQKNSDTLLVLGSYRSTLTEPERPFLIGLNPNLQTLWNNNFAAIDRSYLNAKSVFYKDKDIFWSSTRLKQTGDFRDSFMSVPVTPQTASSPINNSPFKESTIQWLTVNEMRSTSSVLGFDGGYGSIGTIATTAGESSNIFFIRIKKNGDVDEASAKYFDGNTGETESGTSSVQDSGESLDSTEDGGFILAGSTTSTPTFGNGGRDIVLIKLDASGNTEWRKTLGGTGDEIVSTVRAVADGYFICGTSNLGGISSIFVIKTNKAGELKN